jgi:hypothetical protein
MFVNSAPTQVERTVRDLKAVRSDLPIVAISPVSGRQAKDVDHVVSSYEPQLLLQLLADFEAATSEEDSFDNRIA